MKRIVLTTLLGLTMVFGSASIALAATTNNSATVDPYVQQTSPTYPNINAPSTGLKATTVDTVTDDSKNDNGIVNANKTGDKVSINNGTSVLNVIDSVGMVNNEGAAGTQRTHGEYQNNTNSCASCHQTHTAAAKNLLFKNGVYQTCTACHDGTLGFYNVFEDSTAGTFAGTKDGNASVHMATGAMQIKAAPGGDPAGSTNDFNCASCHAPHGSYSDRLLHYSPNSIGTTDMASGGLKIVGANVESSLPSPITADSAEYIVLSTTAGAIGIPAATESADTKVIAVMKKVVVSGGHGSEVYGYQKDPNPWLLDSNSTTKAPSYVKFYTSTGASVAAYSKLTINAAKGYAKNATETDEIAKVAKADISRASYVKFDFDQDIKDFGGIKIRQVDINSYAKKGNGIQISQFCASCHTDYLSESGTPTGHFGTTAYRHNTESDSYTCLKCHFAHGTDVTVMLDAKDQNLSMIETQFKANVGDGKLFADDPAAVAAAKNYMLDKNPSSALKRYTNMSVCWKCHTSSKATTLIQNDWVQSANAAGNGAVPQGWVDPTKTNLPYEPGWKADTPSAKLP